MYQLHKNTVHTMTYLFVPITWL